MMNEYDVIVVGAGCAGPAAAKKSAELGLKTLLLEKAQVPGEKNISGTCLNGAALIIPDLHYLVEGPVERVIREMRTYHINKDRTSVFHEIPSEGILLLSVRRDHFDAWHTEEAKKAGGKNAELIVIIARDSTVQNTKGRKPIMPENQRRMLVESLKVVDEAVLGFENFDTANVIDRIKPNVIALGYDQAAMEKQVGDYINKQGLSIKVVQVGKFEEDEVNSSSKIRQRIVEKSAR